MSTAAGLSFGYLFCELAFPPKDCLIFWPPDFIKRQSSLITGTLIWRQFAIGLLGMQSDLTCCSSVTFCVPASLVSAPSNHAGCSRHTSTCMSAAIYTPRTWWTAHGRSWSENFFFVIGGPRISYKHRRSVIRTPKVHSTFIKLRTQTEFVS